MKEKVCVICGRTYQTFNDKSKYCGQVCVGQSRRKIPDTMEEINKLNSYKI